MTNDTTQDTITFAQVSRRALAEIPTWEEIAQYEYGRGEDYYPYETSRDGQTLTVRTYGDATCLRRAVESLAEDLAARALTVSCMDAYDDDEARDMQAERRALERFAARVREAVADMEYAPQEEFEGGRAAWADVSHLAHSHGLSVESRTDEKGFHAWAVLRNGAVLAESFSIRGVDARANCVDAIHQLSGNGAWLNN